MKENKNAAFVQRLVALLIDLFIISIIVSIFTIFTINNDNYQKLVNESVEVKNNYLDEKINFQTYLSKSIDINYDISRQTAIETMITVAIYILYFIVFQFYKNGQTIGKKIMKIKIISNDSSDLTMNQIAIRSLIINDIFVNLVMLAVVILGTKDIYFVSLIVLEIIQIILIFIISIMILSRKDKRGLHDVITNTRVIKEV